MCWHSAAGGVLQTQTACKRTQPPGDSTASCSKHLGVHNDRFGAAGGVFQQEPSQEAVNKPMGGTLNALRHLQEVERKLGDLRRDEETRRRQVRTCKRQLEKCAQELAAQAESIRHHEAEVRDAELEIDAREQIIQKHRVALNQAKTNREYAAVLTTINTEKADASKLESRAYELMSARDATRAAHEQTAAECARIRKRHAQAEAKLADYVEQTRETCAQLTGERDQVTDTLPPTIVSTFDRAAERLDGEALAHVVKVNPKRDEYVCSGCNMAITLETVNAVCTRDEVVLCNICGRILYHE